MKISVRDLNEAIDRIKKSGKNEVARFLNDSYLIPAVQKKEHEVYISNRNVEILGIRADLRGAIE